MSDQKPEVDRSLLPNATVHLPAIATGTDEALNEPGTPTPDAQAFLELLAETHRVIVVSAIANTFAGNRLLLRWLQSNALPYDEVWTGFGYPLVAVIHASQSES